MKPSDFKPMPWPDPPDDLASQTTARINALNDTLRAIAQSGSDPMQQGREERQARSLLRRSIYAELGRLVGPEVRVELVTRKLELITPKDDRTAFDHAQESRASEKP